MVKVKILGQAVTQYGTHRTGDILNVSAEFARHLVVDARAAEYVAGPAEVAEPESVAEIVKPVATKGKK